MLSRLLGERDRVGRSGRSMGLMPFSDGSPRPPFPSRVDYPVAPFVRSMNM